MISERQGLNPHPNNIMNTEIFKTFSQIPHPGKLKKLFNFWKENGSFSLLQANIYLQMSERTTKEILKIYIKLKIIKIIEVGVFKKFIFTDESRDWLNSLEDFEDE